MRVFPQEVPYFSCYILVSHALPDNLVRWGFVKDFFRSYPYLILRPLCCHSRHTFAICEVLVDQALARLC